MGDSAHSSKGVASNVPTGSRSAFRVGRNAERDIKNHSNIDINTENNNIDVSDNIDGLLTVSAIEKAENVVLSSETVNKPILETDTNNAESTADTAISISEKEKDKTTRLAIARYELQQKMAAMGMYAEIVELPPIIEGLPDEYIAEYAKFKMDVIIKNSEDYIDRLY